MDTPPAAASGPGAAPQPPQEGPRAPAGTDRASTPPPASQGLLREQPVAVFLGGLAGVVDAGVALADALDWVHLTTAQTGALIAFVTTTTGLAGAMLRARVYAPATVARLTGRS